MAINKNTTLPSVPGMGARNAASVFEGVNNALMMYLKLKDQEHQDAIKNRELTRQEASQSSLDNYYKALADDKNKDNSRKDTEDAFKNFNTTVTNYAGSRVPKDSPIVGQATKAGVDPNLAFTTEQTLPATRIPGGIGLPAGGQSSVNQQPGQAAQMPEPLEPNYFKSVPQEATGNVIVNTPESEKVRIAGMNIAGRADVAAGHDTTNLAVHKMTHDDKLAAVAQSKWYQEASLALRKAGLNQAAEHLKLAVAANNRADTLAEWKMKDQEYDNQFHADPLAFLRSLGVSPEGVSGVPGGNGNVPAPHPGTIAKPHTPNPNDPLGLF